MIAAAFKIAAGIAAIAALGAVKEWKTDLTPVGDSKVVGEATVSTMMDAKSMTDTTAHSMMTVTAKIHIKGGAEGESLPWHVHAGTCGSPDAPIVGEAKDYEPIKVVAGGEGDAKATINAQLADTGQYLVNVHKSPDDLTVVSCGQLKRVGDAAESK